MHGSAPSALPSAGRAAPSRMAAAVRGTRHLHDALLAGLGAAGMRKSGATGERRGPGRQLLLKNLSGKPPLGVKVA